MKSDTAGCGSRVQPSERKRYSERNGVPASILDRPETRLQPAQVYSRGFEEFFRILSRYVHGKATEVYDIPESNLLYREASGLAFALYDVEFMTKHRRNRFQNEKRNEGKMELDHELLCSCSASVER